jgi:hypothetical protein
LVASKGFARQGGISFLFVSLVSERTCFSKISFDISSLTNLDLSFAQSNSTFWRLWSAPDKRDGEGRMQSVARHLAPSLLWILAPKFGSSVVLILGVQPQRGISGSDSWSSASKFDFFCRVKGSQSIIIFFRGSLVLDIEPFGSPVLN